MKRYPGPDPFTSEYEHLFFGREDEKYALLSLVAVNRLTVVFGRSGTGKSSLLNAGLVPELEKNYHIIIPRFTGYSDKTGETEKVSITPRETFIGKITEHSKEQYFLQGELTNSEKTNMWYAVKNLQKKNVLEKKRSSDPAKEKKGILIIMDQFEEIFTYPEEDIRDFGVGLGEVINNRMPDQIQRKFYNIIDQQVKLGKHSGKVITADADEQISIPETLETDLELVESEPLLKIIVGIRSDKLSKLENYSAFISGIFNNMFEIKQLTVAKAEKAIIEPALKELKGVEFDSSKFLYDRTAVEKICSYMQSQADKKDNRIEAFQLQMICQRIEQMVIEGQFIAERDGLPLVTAAKLPSLNDVVKKYYKNVLFLKDKNKKDVFGKADRLFIRYLIERKLINRKTRTRLSIDQGLIEPIGISENILNILIDNRLIRVEPNTVHGQSYEICHDTMIGPLMEADEDEEIGNLDKQLFSYYLNQIEVGPNTSHKEKQNNPLANHITSEFLTKASEPLAKSVMDGGINESARINRLLTKRRILRQHEDSKYPFSKLEIYEAFLNPVKAFKSEVDMNNARTGKRRLKAMLTSLLIAGLIIFVLGLFVVKIGEERNRANASLLLNKVDNIDDNGIALRILERAHELDDKNPDILSKISERYARGGFSRGLSSKVGFSSDILLAYRIAGNSKYFLTRSIPKIPAFNYRLDTLQDSPEQKDPYVPEPDYRYFTARIFKFPSDSLLTLDSVLVVSFLGAGDSVAVLRRKMRQLKVEIIDIATKQVKEIRLPNPKDSQLNFFSDQEPWFYPTISYLPREKTVVFMNEGPSSNLSFQNSMDQNALYSYSEEKGWIDFNLREKYVIAARGGSSPLFLLKSRSYTSNKSGFYLSGPLGPPAPINLPVQTHSAKFSNSGNFIIGLTDSTCYIADFSGKRIINSEIRRDIIQVEQVGNYLASVHLDRNGDSGTVYYWQVRNGRLRTVDSFIVRKPIYLNPIVSANPDPYMVISTRISEKMLVAESRYQDSAFITRRQFVQIWRPGFKTLIPALTDSTKQDLYVSLTGGRSIFSVRKDDLKNPFELLIDKNGNVLDKFIMFDRYSTPAQLSNDSKWLINRLDYTSLKVFDFKQKTSSLQVDSILSQLKKSGLIPKLTEEQEETYQTKPESFWKYFFKKR